MKRAHIYIYGDVINVGFRAWTVRNAEKLGLKGWVRNFDERTVEAIFEGGEGKVKEMIELCRRGPEVSWVEKMEVKWEEVEEEFENFEIR
jgi:acylphosphatase